MKLLILLSLGLFFVSLSSFGKLEAKTIDFSNRWDSRPIIDIMKLKITGKSSFENLVEDCLLDGELVSALSPSLGGKQSIKDLEQSIKKFKTVIPSNRLLMIKLSYRLSNLLSEDGKQKRCRKILVKNLNSEIERDWLIESKWRKHLGEKEITTEKMESTEQFKERKAILRKQVRKNFPKAIVYRLVRLYFSGREAEAHRLSGTALKISDLDKLDKDILDAIIFWGCVSGKTNSNLTVDTELTSGNLNKIVNALRFLQDNKPDSATKLLEGLKISDAKYGEANFGIGQFLKYLKAKALFKCGRFKQTKELLTKLCNSTLRRRKGYVDSFIDRPLLLKSLNLFRQVTDIQFFHLYDRSYSKSPLVKEDEHVIQRAVKSAFSKNARTKKGSKQQAEFCSIDVPKINPGSGLNEQEKLKLKLLAFDYYFIGYKYKVIGMQSSSQAYLGLASQIFKTYFPKEKVLVDGCLYDLGESYSWSENFDVASVYLADCFKIRKEIPRNTDALVLTMAALGRSLLKSGEVRQGKAILTDAVAYRVSDIYKSKPKAKNGSNTSSKSKTSSLQNGVKIRVSSESAGLNSDTNSSEFSIAMFQKLSFTLKLNRVKTAYLKADKENKKKLRLALQNWIDSYIASKHYDEAQTLGNLLLAYKMDSSDGKPVDVSDNVWQLAFIASGSGDMKVSKKYYSRLFEQYKGKGLRSTAHWYYARGLAHDALGEYKKASNDFKKARNDFSIHIKDIDEFEDFEDYDYIYWLKEDLTNEIKVGRKDPPNRNSYLKAYSLLSWPKARMPLKVYLDSSRDRGFGPKLFKVVESGIKQWTDISSKTVKFEFVDSSRNADIYVERVDNFDFIPPGSAGRAEAELILTSKKDPSKLNKVHLRIYSKTYNGEELSIHALRHLRTLAAHEFGHALGLNHSPNGKDIMYWKASGTEITKRDKNTLLLLYGCKE